MGKKKIKFIGVLEGDEYKKWRDGFIKNKHKEGILISEIAHRLALEEDVIRSVLK